jgi:RimJ/RimL family protein N-acetyltransferase
MTGRLPDSWRHELAILEDELRALDADIADGRARSEPARIELFSFGHREPKPSGVHGEPATLPDGAEILIRPIEPDDAGELQRGLEHLSAISAYRRFRTHITHAPRDELERLCRIDHVRHEAIVGLEPATGSVVGVVRYVCDPADPAQAEITYVVADAWQHRGVGSVLIDRLAARAREAGVERFIATTLTVDTRARNLLTRVAEPIAAHERDGVTETTARLRPETS